MSVNLALESQFAFKSFHAHFCPLGMFGPLDIGRVYVEDLDDWDLPDKTFTFNGPAWMGNYFR